MGLILAAGLAVVLLEGRTRQGRRRPRRPDMAVPVLLVLHSETSTAGRIGHMLAEKGYALDIRRPCLGDELPATLEHHAGCRDLRRPDERQRPR